MADKPVHCGDHAQAALKKRLAAIVVFFPRFGLSPITRPSIKRISAPPLSQ
jgi:hypothetical protein